MNKIITGIGVLTAVLLLAGCLTDKGELVNDVPPPGYCDSLGASYVDTIKTLVDVHCATSSGCHGSLSFNGDFTTYANMQSAGVLDSSIIGARLFSNDISFVMPQGNPLPDSIKQVFACWISAGFPQQ